MSQPYRKLKPGSTSSAVNALEPVGTVICRMIAVSGRMHSCGVRASFMPRPKSSAPESDVIGAAELVHSLFPIIPVDAKLKPIGEHTDAQQAFGIRMAARAAAAIVVERVGVAGFELNHAVADGDRRFGEVGPIGHQRLFEIRAAFKARAVAPLQERFATTTLSVGGRRRRAPTAVRAANGILAAWRIHRS